MNKIKSNQVFLAYKINDENELDSFLAEQVGEYDGIHKRGERVRVTECGTKLFEFEWGDWLVVYSDINIKNYSNDEFVQKFSVVD